MKRLIIIILALLITMIPAGVACTVVYQNTSNVTIFDNIVSIGFNAVCNVSLYHDNKLNQSGLMTQNGQAYSYNAGNLTDGSYVVGMECNKSINATASNTFYGECKFEVNTQQGLVRNMSEGLQMFGLFITLVSISAIYMFAAFKLHDVHILARIVLFFAAMINLLATTFIGWLDLRGADISDPLLYMFEGNSLVVAVLIGYWFIYVLRKAAFMRKQSDDDWI